MTAAPIFSGPFGAFGGTGPSVFTGGAAPEDPRSATTGLSAAGTLMTGIQFPTPMVTIDAVPSAISATNIATAQVPVAATPLTLTAGTGITKVGSNYYIDGAPATNASSDISKTLARAVTLTSAGDDRSATFTIVGTDLYGNTLTQTVTGSNATTVTTTKAFKSIVSCTPAGTVSGANVSLGVADVFGFPIRADAAGEVIISWNSTLITASTGFVAAVATSPSTATLGDTRGTYATQSASDAAKRLVVYQYPKSLTTTATLFGVTPV